ncbi:MAG: hypothetical protein ACTHKK_03485 [Candidatus Nitrosocosmicus sp.]
MVIKQIMLFYDMSKLTYCDRKGCTNKADTMGIVKEFENFQVEVNVCSNHFYELKKQ